MVQPTPALILNDTYNEAAFNTLIQARAIPGQELRFDPIFGGDLYHGRSTDGADTSQPIWEVVRFYRDVNAQILRARYAVPIPWDDRTNPIYWP